MLARRVPVLSLSAFLASLCTCVTASEPQSEGEVSKREIAAQIRSLSGEVARLKAVFAENEAKRQWSTALPRQSHPRRSASSRRFEHSRQLTAVSSAEVEDLQGALNHMWLLLCGALVMFMQAGFAVVEAGACRTKNVQNILMKNLCDVCAGTICWWAFGWMIAYSDMEAGTTRFAGSGEWFGHDFMVETEVGTITPTDKPLNWFFQWAFCSAGATIVSGGIAERVNFPAYLLYTLWMTTIIYPCVVAWTWSGNGWLQGGDTGINSVGYMDFAGSGIVHMTGGVGALMGATVVGPRAGRWDPGLESQFDPHSLPLVVLGTFILWFGWYGFNCGSTLGMADTATGQLAASVAMNTTVSAATGGLTLLILRFAMSKKYDVGGMCNGILAGLVSITAGCGNVESGSAFCIGLIGALVYQTASSVLRKLKIDDPLDAFAVHGSAGAWGTLAAVVFDWGDGLGVFHGWQGFSCEAVDGACDTSARGKAMVANVVGIISIAAWCAVLSLVVLFPLKKAGLLRAADAVQAEGLDTVKHSPTRAYGVGAFPGLDVKGTGEVSKWRLEVDNQAKVQDSI